VDKVARIFVSSTFKDLEECREKVRLVLRRMGHKDVSMEYFVEEVPCIQEQNQKPEENKIKKAHIGFFRNRVVPGYQSYSAIKNEIAATLASVWKLARFDRRGFESRTARKRIPRKA